MDTREVGVVERGLTNTALTGRLLWPSTALAWLCLIGFASVAATAESNPRVVFNDDAQVLMESPEQGTSRFVRSWLDCESEAVPFMTFVFLAATPDVCTFDSKAGEVYGDRFGAEFQEG